MGWLGQGIITEWREFSHRSDRELRVVNQYRTSWLIRMIDRRLVPEQAVADHRVAGITLQLDCLYCETTFIDMNLVSLAARGYPGAAIIFRKRLHHPDDLHH